MATYKRFEELHVWQKARQFADRIYSHTSNGSFSRDFALRDQINRSTGSIMDNIAEGFERDGNKEFISFLSYSKGSAGEVRAQIYRAFDRKHLDESSFQSLMDEALDISKEISAFMGYLRQTSVKGLKYKEIDRGETPVD